MSNTIDRIRVQCRVAHERDEVRFHWRQLAEMGGLVFAPYKFTGTAMDELCKLGIRLRTCLEGVSRWSWGRDDEDSEAGKKLRIACLDLAHAGWKTYQELFLPDSQQRAGAESAKRVRRWLEDLVAEERAVSLEIQLEGDPFLPWGVLYDQEPKVTAEDFRCATSFSIEAWRPFWNVRHALGAGSRYDAVQGMRRVDNPSELVVYNPKVLPKDVGFDSQRFATSIKELDDDLRRHGVPQLLYWYSHAVPEGLSLQGEHIEPNRLMTLLRRNNSKNSMAFAILNGCRTGEASDVDGSFLVDAVTKANFSGAIVTEAPVLDTFAYKIGEVLRLRLKNGESAVTILHELMQQPDYLPAGLLYSAACRPELSLTRSETTLASVTRPKVQPPTQPFRALSCFQYEDRALFTGREDDADRCATLLADERVRILVVHGFSGVGKSSFLRAGLIPRLEECEAGYFFPREEAITVLSGSNDNSSRALFFEAGPDLANCLVQILVRMHQEALAQRLGSDDQRECIPNLPSESELRSELLSDPDQHDRFLSYMYDQIEHLPNTPVIIIDQFEQIYTLSPTDHTVDVHADNRAKALQILRTVAMQESARFKLILSLRTEYAAQIQNAIADDLTNDRAVITYLLGQFPPEKLEGAINAPTKYEYKLGNGQRKGFRFSGGLVKQLADAILQRCRNQLDSPLPIAQLLCKQLYDRLPIGGDRTILVSTTDLQRIVDSGLSAHVNDLLLESPKPEAAAVRELLILLHQRHSDKVVATKHLPLADAEDIWVKQTKHQPKSTHADFQKFLSKWEHGHQLFRRVSHHTGGDEAITYLSLGHDALATVAERWAVERESQERKKQFMKVATIASILLLLTIGSVFTSGLAWLWHEEALNETKKANDQTKKAKAQGVIARKNYARQLGVQSEQIRNTQPICSLLLAVEGIRVTSDSQDDPEALVVSSLATGLSSMGGTRLVSKGWSRWGVSENGRWVIAMSQDGSVNIWDLNISGCEPKVTTLQTQRYALNSVAISSNGRWIAGNYADGTRIWDLQDMTKSSHTFAASSHNPKFSSDSKWLTTTLRSTVVTLWSLEGGVHEACTLSDNDKPLTRTEISADGSCVITIRDKTFTIWKLDFMRMPRVFLVDTANCIAFSPNGRWVAAAGDQSVRVWDMHQNNSTPSKLDNTPGVNEIVFDRMNQWLLHRDNLHSVRLCKLSEEHAIAPMLSRDIDASSAFSVSSDGRWLACGRLKDNSLGIWDLSNPQAEPWVLSGHEDKITFIRFSPNGKTIVTESRDSTIRIWDMNTLSYEPKIVETSAISPIGFSEDTQKLAVVDQDGVAHLWNLHDWTEKKIVLGNDIKTARYMQFSEAGNMFAAVTRDKSNVLVWDVTRPEAEILFLPWKQIAGSRGSRPMGPIDPQISFSRDGKRIGLTSNGVGYLWSTIDSNSTPRLLQDVGELVFSPDGKHVAYTSVDYRVIIEEVASPGNTTRIILRHDNSVCKVVFSKDGRWLATFCMDRKVRIWDWQNPDVLPKVLEGLEDQAYLAHGAILGSLGAAFSPDGAYLAFHSVGKSPQIWDLRSESREPHDLFYHQALMRRMSFSSDGRWLATVCQDSSVRVWSMTNTQSDPRVLRGHFGFVNVSFDKDGNWLATTSRGKVRLWSLNIKHMMSCAKERAGRNITWAEWQLYFRGTPYHRTFDELPWPNDLPSKEKTKAELEEKQRLVN